ncbi:MAG: hypothetical protein V4510_01120 [bacterium]
MTNMPLTVVAVVLGVLGIACLMRLDAQLRKSAKVPANPAPASDGPPTTQQLLLAGCGLVGIACGLFPYAFMAWSWPLVLACGVGSGVLAYFQVSQYNARNYRGA